MVDARNQADMLVFQIEKFLGENGDKVDAADKAKLEDEMKNAKEAMKSENIDEIKAATERLQKVSNEVFTKLYQQSGGAQNPGDGNNGSAGNNGDNVVDAEEV